MHSMENKQHDHAAVCPHCPPKSDKPAAAPGAKTKLTSFLGICGCISCYVAMFPALLLGVIGVLGLSTSAAAGALNAYMASVWFQPVLVVSILFLIAGIFRYGALPLWLSILGGAGIFVSMNFYMHAWLFTFSFALLALAYFLAYQKSRAPQLKFAFILLVLVVALGVVDIGRDAFASAGPKDTTAPQQHASPSMIQM